MGQILLAYLGIPGEWVESATWIIFKLPDVGTVFKLYVEGLDLYERGEKLARFNKKIAINKAFVNTRKTFTIKPMPTLKL